jgi:hypothetical protein
LTSSSARSVRLLATLREREGLALALDYVLGIYFSDPSDEIHAAEAYLRTSIVAFLAGDCDIITAVVES